MKRNIVFFLTSVFICLSVACYDDKGSYDYKDVNEVEVDVAISKPNEAIDQSAYVCYESQKMGIVDWLFKEPAGTKTIVFSSSKQKVKELAFSLKNYRKQGGYFSPACFKML